jgi:hypothetical protein
MEAMINLPRSSFEFVVGVVKQTNTWIEMETVALQYEATVNSLAAMNRINLFLLTKRQCNGIHGLAKEG